MGYTHYWYRPGVLASRDAWARFLDDWRKIERALAGRGVGLVGVDGGDPVERSIACSAYVAFDGVSGQSCETFVLERIDRTPRAQSGVCFSFCKTERLPYDLAVTSCLLAAVRHFPHRIAVATDGQAADWNPARELCQEALGYGERFTFLIGEPESLLLRRTA